MKIRAFFLFALMCLLSGAMAQNKVSGTIVDEKTNKGIPFVNVGLFRQTDSVFVSGAAADDKGVFVLQGLPNGNYNLKVSAIGYQVFEQFLEVKGNLDLGKLKLKEGAVNLNEVVITETRPLFSVEGEKTMYNTTEDPSIQTGTASDALQNAPGVEVDVEGNITLRGAESVEIWINDKPSHLSAENLKTYIQSMPANTIDRIEVITNPSARYGSQADGIINIVTNAKVKRNEFVSFGVNASTRPFVSPWVSYVWSNEKLSLNLYASGTFNHHNSESLSTDTILTKIDGEMVPSSYRKEWSKNKAKQFGAGLFADLSYEVDSANELSFWLGAMPNWGNSMANDTIFREELLSQAGVYNYFTGSNDRSNGIFAHGGVYYRHKFNQDGHQISASINGNFNSDKSTSFDNRRYVSPYEYNWDRRTGNSGSNPSVSADVNYVLPFSEKQELALGVQSSYSNSSNVNVVDTLVGENYVNDIWRSSGSSRFTNRNEVYATYQQKIGDFTIKPGLRLQNYNTGIRYDMDICRPMSDTCNFNASYFNILPSLHLSYRTKSMHNFKLSYTRRVNNPQANQLTRFATYNDESFSTGNPELSSVYTNSIEFGWTKYWKSFGSVGLSGYYKGKSSEINTVRVSAYDDLFGREVIFSQPVNIGRSYNAGAEANLMIRPSGFFNVRIYANVYNSYLETVFDGETVKNSMWSYSFRCNLWAKLWNKLEIHAQAYYRSPVQSLYSVRESRYGVNCGLKADFFERKMSVYVNAQDLLNSARNGSTNTSPYLISSSTNKYNMRSISVGVTFRFGKMELEKQARQGGSADEAGGEE